MSKSVLVLCGSPRKRSNSTIMADSLIEGVLSAEGECEKVVLHPLNLSPCCGCDACVKTDESRCVIKDEMQELYPKIDKADALVLASPVYWFTVSAQTKIFLDRLYSYFGPSGFGLKGKSLALILSFADSDAYTSGAVNAIRTLQDASRLMGVSFEGVVYAQAAGEGAVLENENALKKSFNLGKRLAS